MEMRTAFDGLMGRQDTAQKRISALEHMLIEISKTEKETEDFKKRQKKPRTEYPRTVGQ